MECMAFTRRILVMYYPGLERSATPDMESSWLAQISNNVHDGGMCRGAARNNTRRGGS